MENKLRGLGNKYSAERCYSLICKRTFDSKAELRYGELLHIREKAGNISCLEYHQRLFLSLRPKVSIEVDFVFLENGIRIYQDCKGKETREYRVKRIWAKQLLGIEIELVKGWD